MRNAYKLVMVAIIAALFSYCSNKPSKAQEKVSDAGIVYSVKEDVLTVEIRRRLAALEMVTVAPMRANPYIIPVSASEAVHSQRPPE